VQALYYSFGYSREEIRSFCLYPATTFYFLSLISQDVWMVFDIQDDLKAKMSSVMTVANDWSWPRRRLRDDMWQSRDSIVTWHGGEKVGGINGAIMSGVAWQQYLAAWWRCSRFHRHQAAAIISPSVNHALRCCTPPRTALFILPRYAQVGIFYTSSRTHLRHRHARTRTALRDRAAAKSGGGARQ
jgi:hypothetical protein